MSDKLALTKLAAQVVSGVGVQKVVSDVIRNNTTVETMADFAKVSIGSIVIGSLVADASTNHVNQKIDAVTAWWNKRQAEKASSSS